MTFAAPLVLVALVAIPLLGIWYAGHQRARRRAAAAFAAPRLAGSVTPNRPGWRRHAPILVFAIALAALIVAAARPQRTVAVPVERASIMLVTDVSGSMEATDVAPSRLVAARRAAKRFVARVPAKVNVGVMAFNEHPQVLQSPTTDRGAVDDALDRLRSSGGTATGSAIQAAVRILDRAGGPKTSRRPPAAIVLLSDGVSVRGVDPLAAARQARARHIPVYTVALGTPQGTITVPRPGGGTEIRPVPPDPESLAQIARASGGRTATATGASALDQVYERLGSLLARRDVKREVTAGFAGGALALLLLGFALSLRWFGRLI